MPKVVINYKSGLTVEVKCESFLVTKDTQGIKRVECVKGVPKALYFGVDDIESLWEV